MSIAVDLDDLPDAVGERGPGYLLTTVADGRPHVMHVRLTVDDDGRLCTDVGRTATANIGAQPAVTVVWPPLEDGGMSLIVDGEAIVDDGAVTITPVGAVLHRPA